MQTLSTDEVFLKAALGNFTASKCQMWWHMLIISATQEAKRQEDLKFKANLENSMTLSQI